MTVDRLPSVFSAILVGKSETKNAVRRLGQANSRAFARRRGVRARFASEPGGLPTVQAPSLPRGTTETAGMASVRFTPLVLDDVVLYTIVSGQVYNNEKSLQFFFLVLENWKDSRMSFGLAVISHCA